MTVPPVLAIVIEPDAFVIDMFVPAVKVVLVNPVPLPISKVPLAGVLERPVPPFATANVPAKVIAPDVALDGVSPVVPPLKVVTATPLSVVHCGAVPLEVRICPEVPIPKVEVVEVPV